MLYKHLFSILCGHLNLNQKRKKNWIWPVTSQTGRYTGTGPNRLNWKVWIQIWIWPVPTGNRHRTGIPEPESSGLAGSVGKVNPACTHLGVALRVVTDAMWWEDRSISSMVDGSTRRPMCVHALPLLVFSDQLLITEKCISISVSAECSCPAPRSPQSSTPIYLTYE